MKFSQFISEFFESLEANNIQTCVLRNYQEFPESNVGRDIDLLLRKQDLELVLNILRNIDKIDVTSVLKRAYVHSVYIWGVEVGDDCNGLQIDLTTSLCFKGVEYLSVEKVLATRSSMSDSMQKIFIPEPHYEALNTYFSSYLVGGWIKDKYQNSVIDTFERCSDLVISELTRLFGSKLANMLYSMIIRNDRKGQLDLLACIRSTFLTIAFLKRPLEGFVNIFRYYFLECRIRFTPYPLYNICILGPDGSGKSTLIRHLRIGLIGIAKEIECIHLKPSVFRQHEIYSTNQVVIPYSKSSRNQLVSVAKLLWWVLLYWMKNLFHGHRGSTIRIWDRYFYDVYIDPLRYRNGASIRISKILSYIVPRPNLIFVLDASEKVIQERTSEVTLVETKNQRNNYLKFVRNSSKLNVRKINSSLGEEDLYSTCRNIIIKDMAKLNGAFETK